MYTRTSAAALILLTFIQGGCGSDAPTNGTQDAGNLDSGDSTQDSGPIADGGATDLGGADPCADLPATSVNGDGVLSAYPQIDYAISSGFRLDTVGFKITVDGDSRGPLLEMFAEVTNTSLQVQCSFLPDVSLDFEELLGTVEGNPYYNQFGSSVDCIGPGEKGILRALARGLDRSDLALADSLTISMEPFNLGTYTVATDGPTVTAANIVPDALGYRIDGSLLIDTTIYNYGYRAYPRDSRGVLVDELLAFPNELGTLSGGSTVPFATEATRCSFSTFHSLQSWLKPTVVAVAARAGAPEGSERDALLAARDAQLEALR